MGLINHLITGGAHIVAVMEHMDRQNRPQWRKTLVLENPETWKKKKLKRIWKLKWVSTMALPHNTFDHGASACRNTRNWRWSFFHPQGTMPKGELQAVTFLVSSPWVGFTPWDEMGWTGPNIEIWTSRNSHQKKPHGSWILSNLYDIPWKITENVCLFVWFHLIPMWSCPKMGTKPPTWQFC